MSNTARLIAVTLGAAVVVVIAVSLLSSGDEDSAIEAFDPDSLYNPVRAGEEVPKSFRELLPRDAIRPIYDPSFVSAADSEWHDKTLVVGLEINGDARAYPVSHLNRREIVNDHVGKTPVLVTW